jgi:hypothetical protein
VLILVALFGSAATYATYHARLGQFRDTSGTPSLLATDDQVEIATTLSAMKPLEQSAAGQACHSKAPSHLIDFGGVQVVPGDGCIGYRVTSKKKEG